MTGPRASSLARRHRREQRFRRAALACGMVAVLMLVWLLATIVKLAWPVIVQADISTLLGRADSADPGRAGLATAGLGSVLMLLIVAALSLPLGIVSAIYLQAFAPRTGPGARAAQALGVMVNNLAAVPGIVYGLLGLALLINGVGLARSAVLTGGVVLALRVFPTVVISSRGALSSVPDNAADGALALGASRMQAVFGHLLPLAGPGIVTGALLALAQALGEAAPLLLIGMLAFVSQPPASISDPATALPVQTYMWILQGDPAWEARAGAAVLVLLLLILGIHGLAALARHWLHRGRS